MVKIESELFSQIVKKKSISHPTARNFDPAQWKAAAAKLTNPTERDQQLLAAGIYYGSEIKRLRDHFENRIFERLDRRTGILLTLAMANLNHRILGQKSKALARKRSCTSEVIDPMAIARQPISSSYPENRAAPDAAVATIVDTIPHCLERAFRSTNSCDPLRNFHDAGSELFAIMSIEHALRDLWQQVLWDGWKLARDADDSKTLRHIPTDRELATLWDVWVWRQEMIMFQGAMLDELNDGLRATRGHFIKPFVDPTVVGIGGHSKESRRLRFGSLSGREHGQAWHTAEQTILNECYLTDFLDTPLPKLAVSLSCSDLQTAWRILRDCASVLAARCKEMRLTDVDSIERHSLLISRAELERAIGACTKLSKEQIETALNFFTCDPNDLSALFNKGVWASPILEVDDGKNVALTLPAILVGSAIRRVESWLDRGGLSDLLPTARRGMRYEAWVRTQISSGIAKNPLLSSGRCSLNSIDRRDPNGEQIDLLILLGNTVIVGEVKCLLAPVESMEHYNYLSHLNEAGHQVSRKAEWLAANPDILAEALSVSTEHARSLRHIPIVVVNQGAGLGLLAGGVRTVDFHFLSLYLSEGGYHSGTGFKLDAGSAVSSRHEFYSNEQEAESRFVEIMANPPTLQRFLKAAHWVDNSLPTSTDQNFVISTCSFREEASEDARALAPFLREGLLIK